MNISANLEPTLARLKLSKCIFICTMKDVIVVEKQIIELQSGFIFEGFYSHNECLYTTCVKNEWCLFILTVLSFVGDGADVRLADEKGRTPLHFAVTSGNNNIGITFECVNIFH